MYFDDDDDDDDDDPGYCDIHLMAAVAHTWESQQFHHIGKLFA